MTLKSILTDATKRLNNNEAALEAQLLLQHVLNVNRAWLIAHENDALQPNIHAVFEALLQRRLNGEPIAYILGYREFYGLKLKTTPDTLIPRPDTEALVEAALMKIQLAPLPRGERGGGEGNSQLSSQPSPSPQPSPTLGGGSKIDCELPPSAECLLEANSRLRGNDEISSNSQDEQKLHILDLGTGTGAIALAIAHNRPNAQVTAVDFSAKALAVARENAQNLTILNCQFLQSDWFSALTNQRFDVIVSNPPYIAQNDAHLTQGDLRFEPASALASGADGLDDIRHIISHAKNHLNPHGYLMLEHGYDQAEQVAALLKQAGFGEIETIKDLGSNDRVTLGRMG